MDQWLDWPAFGFLALLTLLDGLRRVPAGALVLRKIAGGKWEVVELREGYRLVSWWPPLTTTLILAPTDRSTAEPEALLPRVRSRVTFLMIVGCLSLVAMVIILPISMRWWGGMGFLLSLLLVFLLSWLVTGFSFYASKPLELGTRQRLMFALPRLNPFATPAAGEALLERALGRCEPLAVARLLMEEAEFVRWVRPLAYDVVGGVEGGRGGELVKLVGRKQLTAILSTRPLGVAALSPWCQRCGSEFGSASTVCPSCEIPLQV